VRIASKIVTAVFGDCFYAEEPEMMAGIRVVPAVMPVGLAVGRIVEVCGTMQTANHERFVAGEAVAPGGSTTIGPASIVNRNLGGGPLGLQEGITADCAYVTSSGLCTCGLNNIGLLVRSWGTVTEVGTDCFWIDDGFGIAGDVGHRGVRVVTTGLQVPEGLHEGAYALATGISGSVEIVGGKLARKITPRNSDDIVIIEHS
jgi:hypothetical protein